MMAVANDVVADRWRRRLFDPSPSSSPFVRRQVRWKGRNDGARYARRGARPPTKKQRRAHNRRLRRLRLDEERHSPPGSIAGLRREWLSMEKNDLLNEDKEEQQDDPRLDDDYTADDALLDDLMGNSASKHGHADARTGLPGTPAAPLLRRRRRQDGRVPPVPAAAGGGGGERPRTAAAGARRIAVRPRRRPGAARVPRPPRHQAVARRPRGGADARPAGPGRPDVGPRTDCPSRRCSRAAAPRPRPAACSG